MNTLQALIQKLFVRQPVAEKPNSQPRDCNYSNNYYGDQVCRHSKK